ncbi:hypothetical protein ACG7TL_000998 [Trametes sanguinea]
MAGEVASDETAGGVRRVAESVVGSVGSNIAGSVEGNIVEDVANTWRGREGESGGRKKAWEFGNQQLMRALSLATRDVSNWSVD